MKPRASASLRPYAMADFPAVCAVHDAARPLELERGGVDPVAGMRPMEEVAERDAFFDSKTLVAEADGRVVAFVSWWDDFISWLYVDPEYQRQGLGRHLIAAAMERTGDQAWATALAGNGASIGLFRSLGFEVVKRWADDCEGIPTEAVRLALPTSHMANPKAGVE